MLAIMSKSQNLKIWKCSVKIPKCQKNWSILEVLQSFCEVIFEKSFWEVILGGHFGKTGENRSYECSMIGDISARAACFLDIHALIFSRNAEL